MGTKGRKINGIHSLEDLMDRSDVSELTDCWIWRGLTYEDGAPRITAVVDGKRITARGRKVGLLLAGVKQPKGKLAIPRDCCHDKRCISPHHSKFGSVRDSWDRLVDSGQLRGLAVRSVLAAKHNAPRTKVTPEIVDLIRSSDETCRVLGDRYGISPNTAWRIRTYKAHVRKGASVFTWRP
jgi:hypothetical protein